MIVDSALYRGGQRQNEAPLPLDEAACYCNAGAEDGAFVWIGLREPGPGELAVVQERFELHPLAVEDAGEGHERPKLEEYGDGAFFIVLRTARYDDAREEVEFGEVHMFLGPGYVVTARRGIASDLHPARLQLERHPELVGAGPASVVWAALDKIVDDYHPVVEGLEGDIEEVETGVFAGRGDLTERVYFLRREVVSFYRAVHPLLAPLDALEFGAFREMPEVLREYFRDVNDHLKVVNDELAQQRDLLASVLQANMAVMTHQQNEVVRKVSAWAAIITVPALIASIYGMNFNDMPELGWGFGYPFALALMGGAAFALWHFFRRSGWL